MYTLVLNLNILRKRYRLLKLAVKTPHFGEKSQGYSLGFINFLMDFD